MAIARIPPPLSHPILGPNGLVTVPWAEYFRAMAIGVDNAGYMRQSVYDPSGSGVVNDSSALQGQSGSYYLALENATGLLPYGQTQWNIRPVTADATAAAGDFIDVDSTGGNVDVTLPDPASNYGASVAVRRADGGANTVAMIGAINGASSFSLTAQYTTIVVVSVGYEWAIV